MAAPHVTVIYVDGATLAADVGVWRSLRPDGVDAIEVSSSSGNVRLGGHSLYWCYREGDAWVFGSGSPYSALPPEVLVHDDGTMTSRAIDYMPDLRHGRIKLGWWRPGEARPDKEV